MKTTPAEEIADGKALELTGHRIYLSCEPYKGKLVSTGLFKRCSLSSREEFSRPFIFISACMACPINNVFLIIGPCSSK